MYERARVVPTDDGWARKHGTSIEVSGHCDFVYEIVGSWGLPAVAIVEGAWTRFADGQDERGQRTGEKEKKRKIGLRIELIDRCT